MFSAAHQAADQDPARSKLLSSHLERLLAGAPAAQQAEAGGNTAWPPAGKLHYLDTTHQLVPDRQSERPNQLDFSPKAERPHLDKLLFKAGANRHPVKDHLDSIDGSLPWQPSIKDERLFDNFFDRRRFVSPLSSLDKLLQNMVTQMGGHSFNLEALMGNDFEELARVLTGALQEEHPLVVSKPGPGGLPSKEGDRKPPAGATLTEDVGLKFGKVPESNQNDAGRVKQTGV